MRVQPVRQLSSCLEGISKILMCAGATGIPVIPQPRDFWPETGDPAYNFNTD